VAKARPCARRTPARAQPARSGGEAEATAKRGSDKRLTFISMKQGSCGSPKCVLCVLVSREAAGIDVRTGVEAYRWPSWGGCPQQIIPRYKHLIFGGFPSAPFETRGVNKSKQGQCKLFVASTAVVQAVLRGMTWMKS